jgi:hypothetical protein
MKFDSFSEFSSMSPEWMKIASLRLNYCTAPFITNGAIMRIILAAALLAASVFCSGSISAQSSSGSTPWQPQCDQWAQWVDSAGVTHTIYRPDGSAVAYHMTDYGMRDISHSAAQKLINTAIARGRDVWQTDPPTDPICF